LLQPLLHR